MYGLIVKQVRESKNITQLELANVCKVSQAYIAMVENGQRLPSDDLHSHICMHLATDLTPQFDKEKSYHINDVKNHHKGKVVVCIHDITITIGTDTLSLTVDKETSDEEIGRLIRSFVKKVSKHHA